MNCKNCGARINAEARVCPNCGARLPQEGYVLLTGNDMELDEEPYYYEPPKKKKTFLKIISVILIIAILAGGGYFLVEKYLNPPKPEMSFSSGYGFINGNEPIIYVEIGQKEQPEYIHGVKLFAYDKTQEASNVFEAISSDYEYTKSVDGTFRAIFFDASDFELEDNEKYTYTFEMSFSFYNNSKIYVYEQTVYFTNKFNNDLSEIIFDHSMDSTPEQESSTKPVTEPSTEPSTEPEETTQADASFIYNGFWFMTPYNDGDKYNISSVKFEQNGKCSLTHFYKEGSANWVVSNSQGTYEIKGSTLMVTDSEGLAESYTIDSQTKTISGLEARKFNSTKNAEDFFGI